MGLSESASGGDRLSTLRDLRDVLARCIEACDSMRDVAALAGRLQSVLDEIARLDPPKADSDGIDEIAKRRTTRRSVAAKSPVRAKRSG